jgi:hypothetical protein
LDFSGKTLLLKSKTGSGHGIPTAWQAVRIARYQPDIRPKKPKPPAQRNSVLMCSISLAASGCDRKVCSGDKGEEHDEPEECKGEEEVDAKGTDQEDEAGEYPAWLSVIAFPHTGDRKCLH